ncbi:MAG: hypothetical protein KJ676_13405 [Alphaproteobacteria bacterium]|nr:hypothetical protein [Alphaproteobacteria bacterium]MBU1525770.1 hypothetical protein [Alphaproteobacteria bacterium]MBU2116722.1 hypothetical protein [Alphaproteobacteria bacterium]MBU2351044.1 hypothetical protein [Alphaproteobacteria bacterium]MBU2383390.1 hypothetical protein [Alphaproteobacteria bacterium]
MARFARVTELDGKVHWVNLDHVRTLSVLKPMKGLPVRTAVHVDSSWVERVLHVSETPEQILAPGHITE